MIKFNQDYHCIIRYNICFDTTKEREEVMDKLTNMKIDGLELIGITDVTNKYITVKFNVKLMKSITEFEKYMFNFGC